MWMDCSFPELSQAIPCLDEARGGARALGEERLGQRLQVLPAVLVREQPVLCWFVEKRRGRAVRSGELRAGLVLQRNAMYAAS